MSFSDQKEKLITRNAELDSGDKVCVMKITLVNKCERFQSFTLGNELLCGLYIDIPHVLDVFFTRAFHFVED